ncbi:MAG: hypothetical protein ACKO1M_06160 [Planctomycetota bacterium]
MTSAPAPSGSIVHEIRWSDALPWWMLFRAAGAAFSPTVILLAAVGAAAVWAGWSAADRAGLTVPAAILAPADGGLALPSPSGVAVAADPLAPSAATLGWLRGLASWLPTHVTEAARMVTLPFRPTTTLADAGAALARVGWFVLVWAIFGTAICRCVALKLAGEEPIGPVGGVAFGSTKWPPAFNSVLFVFIGIAALSVPGALLGLAMRTEWGLSLAGAVWPLVLLGAVVLAILAVGLVAAWPLMVAAIGVERGDSFQAISTAFSYLYQRPLHYAFYLLVGLLVALPALAVAGLFADATGTLALWAASFGMGHDRTAAVVDGLASAGPLADTWGLGALRFWTRGLTNVLASFGWGYFWAIATASYLVLRQDVDGTPLDEVVLDEPRGQAS